MAKRQLYCVECGDEMAKADRFCASCGAAVDGDDEPVESRRKSSRIARRTPSPRRRRPAPKSSGSGALIAAGLVVGVIVLAVGGMAVVNGQRTHGGSFGPMSPAQSAAAKVDRLADALLNAWVQERFEGLAGANSEVIDMIPALKKEKRPDAVATARSILILNTRAFEAGLTQQDLEAIHVRISDMRRALVPIPEARADAEIEAQLRIKRFRRKLGE